VPLLNEQYSVKTYGGVVVEVHVFLTLALDGGKLVSFTPCRFTPAERAPGTHWIGGWVSPRAGLEDNGEVKIIPPYWDSNSDPSVVQPAGSRCTDYATAAHNVYGV
jgi:hypothetical protein